MPVVRILVGTSMLWAITAYAQSPLTPLIPAEDRPNAVANIGSDPVGPGDLLYVAVIGSPELTRSFRVTAAGTLSVPLLADPIHINGLTPSQIEIAVARELERKRILVSPVVSVTVLEYRSRPVNIAGAVKRPVTIQALNGLKLLDAISQAAGLAPEAGPEILVSRSNESEIQRISVKDLIAGANPALNIELRGGEQIRVPEAGKLFVVGNVKSPGTFLLNEPGGSSVMKALAMSQGLLPYARKEAYVYRLLPDRNERQEILVPLNQILRRKAPDFTLLPNDIFYVPDNSAKRLSATMIERITGVAGSTLSGLIIWGR